MPVPFPSRRPSRVAAIAAALVAAVLTVGLGASSGAPKKQALTKIRFQLVWTASANAMPFIAAKQEGFYEDAGLDVEIIESQDPTAALPLVASGARDLGASYPPDILLGAAKGLKVVGIWSQYQVNPLGIVSRADRNPIRKPKDLIGKTVGITVLPMDRAQFFTMLKKNGVSKDQVKVVDPGFNGGTLVGQGKLAGASAVPWFEVVALKLAGQKPILMQYRHHGGGVDFGFIVTIANKKFAERKPAAVRAFVRASIRGYTWAKANRTKAVDDVMQMFPRLNRRMQQIMWDEVIKLSESPLTREKGIGYFDMAKLRGLERFLVANKILTKRVDVASAFTNRYTARGR